MAGPDGLICCECHIEGSTAIRTPSQISEKNAKDCEQNDSEPELRWIGICEVTRPGRSEPELWHITGESAPYGKRQPYYSGDCTNDDPEVAINSGGVRVVLHGLSEYFLWGLTPELSRAAKRCRLE